MYIKQSKKMTKTPKYSKQIEENREKISKMLSGVDTVKRLNNFNWLRHEISYTEPRILFYVPTKEQIPYLDYNSMKNLGEAYDYILQNTNKNIDISEICKIHSTLCTGTHIQGGLFRTTNKVLELKVNGRRFHAPAPGEILSKMNEIIFRLNSPDTAALNRAYRIHYDLIMLQPFDDFNKRTARLIMNWVLIQNGYRPIVFNQSTDKQKYKEAITACANGYQKEYISYMSYCMARTQKQIISLLNNSKML